MIVLVEETGVTFSSAKYRTQVAGCCFHLSVKILSPQELATAQEI